MFPVATTARLELLEFSEADAAGFHALNRDAEVLRYTGDDPFPSVDSARAFIRRYDHYARHGFGRWSVYLKEPRSYVGFCGLRRDDDTGEVDLGFRIARAYWGRGYATEAAVAALELGFGRFELDAIIGRAMIDNAASHRVLAKLGFVRRHGPSPDPRWLVYELTRVRFTRGSPAD